jgi:hypothetical protein
MACRFLNIQVRVHVQPEVRHAARRPAESDEQNRELWLSMAERWAYLAREAPLCFAENAPFKW